MMTIKKEEITCKKSIRVYKFNGVITINYIKNWRHRDQKLKSKSIKNSLFQKKDIRIN